MMGRFRFNLAILNYKKKNQICIFLPSDLDEQLVMSQLHECGESLTASEYHQETRREQLTCILNA